MPLIVWICLLSNFSGGLRKTFFSARVHFDHSRSSKVTDYCTSQKHVRNFLLVCVIVSLVLSCTISELLQVFVLLTPPLFHPIFGVFPLE